MNTTTPSRRPGACPQVSVIIPVYNAESHLRECLGSVLGQTLKSIEVIAVNDGSTDSSARILRDYAGRDARVVVIEQANQGPGPARNCGLAAATGEFVAFMDPDDWYPELDVLETLYAEAKRQAVKICGGSMSACRDGKMILNFTGILKPYTFERDGKIAYRDYQFDYGYTRFIYDRALLRDNHIEFPPYRRFQDPPFFTAAMVCAGEFHALRKTTYCYRQSGAGIQWSPDKVRDYLLGVTANLTLSAAHRLARLHHLTYSRMMAPWQLRILLAHMQSGDPALSAVLLRTLGALDLALLREVDPGLAVGKILGQFHGPLRKLEEETGRPAPAPAPPPPPRADPVERMCALLGRLAGGEVLPGAGFGAIAFICTDADFRPACVALASLIGSKDPVSRYAVHIVDGGLSEESRNKLLSLGTAAGVDLTLVVPPAGESADRDRLKRRLPQLLPDCERVLLLENEVLVRRDLCTLFATPLAGAVAAAGPDFDRMLARSGSAEAGDMEFNDGAVLLDLAALRTRCGPAGAPPGAPWLAGLAALGPGAMRPFPPAAVMANQARFVDREARILAVLGRNPGVPADRPEFFNDVWIADYRSVAKPWETVTAMYSDEWWARCYASPAYAAVAVASAHPRVSVVVPVYNVEPYLRKCLDSAVNQSLRDIEIICVNDGSTDGSAAIVAEYAARDARIRVLTQANAGLSAARNAGMRIAQGDYLAFLDSDDALALSALGELCAAADRLDLDVLYYDGETVFESTGLADQFSHFQYARKQVYPDAMPGGQLLAALVANDDYKPSACLQCLRRAYLQRIGLRFYEGILHEDNLFTLLGMLRAPRAAHINRPFYLRLIRAGSIMTTRMGFKNFTGLFITYLEMTKALAVEGCSPEAASAAQAVAAGVLRVLTRVYVDLTEEERAAADRLVADCTEFGPALARGVHRHFETGFLLYDWAYKKKMQDRWRGLMHQEKERHAGALRKLKKHGEARQTALRRELARQRRNFEQSLSWRLTAPLRALGAWRRPPPA